MLAGIGHVMQPLHLANSFKSSKNSERLQASVLCHRINKIFPVTGRFWGHPVYIAKIDITRFVHNAYM